MAASGSIDVTSTLIKWRIPDYYSMPPAEEHTFISPRFRFLEGEWYLVMFVWGRSHVRTAGKIVVCLKKVCLRTGIQRFLVDVLIENSRLDVVGRWSGEHEIYVDEVDLGTAKFVEGTEFVCVNKLLDLPHCLRVFCRLTERSGKDETTKQMPKVFANESRIEDGEEKRAEKYVSGERNAEDSPTGLDIVCQNLRDLFLNERLSDVTFRIEDVEFRAHRAILAARSPVFQAMMEHDTKEKRSGVIEISDCSAAAFKEFLQYLYSGRAEGLSQENMCDVYRLADKYDVGHLRTECVAFMVRSLNEDNFCDLITLAATHNESELVEIATDFFVKQAKSILPTAKWQTFMAENVTVANELFLKRISKLG